jgi:hypothetical protein
VLKLFAAGSKTETSAFCHLDISTAHMLFILAHIDSASLNFVQLCPIRPILAHLCFLQLGPHCH